MSTVDMPSAFGKSLRLPEAMRKELRIPLGRILDGDEFREEVKGVENLVTVGDYCTVQALEAGVEPKVAIVDLTVERRRDTSILEQPRLRGATVLKVKNPPGQISESLWGALEVAFQGDGPYLLQVEGEEDLAALPAIALAPEHHTVVYGQPREGAVFVRVQKDSKARVSAILSRMEVLDGS